MLDYFEQHEPSDFWNTIVEDDGSILIDPSNKVIIFYGGEYTQLHVPRSRLFLKLMQYVWMDWDIRWADRGLFDIVDYINLPRNIIDYTDYFRYVASEDFLIDMLNPNEIWHDGIVSVKLLDGQIRLQQASSFFDILTLGKKLIETVWGNGTSSILEWYSEDYELPSCGIHIDTITKKLYFWSAYPVGNRDFLQVWQDWEIIWLANDFEAHLNLTHNMIKLEIPSEDDLLEELRAYLLVNVPHAKYVELNGYFSSVPVISNGVEIPDYANHLVDKLPPIEERTKIFNQAVEKWRASH